MFKGFFISATLLLAPVFLCFVECLIRGIKAKVRERRERKEAAIIA